MDKGRSGGTRGGRDRFNWEDVIKDKQRDNYLGTKELPRSMTKHIHVFMCELFIIMTVFDQY